MTEVSEFAQRVLDGNVRAAARLMRWLDDGMPQGIEVLKELYPHLGRAWVVGLTGSPGAGKSTLTNALIKACRARDWKVGVVAVDPTSPFSGGAILGDRIRMQEHETDPGVFIRSIATRGSLGGLSRSTGHCIQVLDAFGCDIILVETVGVGQDEVEIVREADTSIVVTVPGMGDDIQAIKAGILEIADLFVINKADRDGVDRTEKELRIMLELLPHPEDKWMPSITRTVAVRHEGIGTVLEEIDRHKIWLQQHPDPSRSHAARAINATISHLQNMLSDRAIAIAESEDAGATLQQVRSSKLDPFSAAEVLLQKVKESL